jgi:hypothetical protein
MRGAPGRLSEKDAGGELRNKFDMRIRVVNRAAARDTNTSPTLRSIPLRPGPVMPSRRLWQMPGEGASP